MSETFMRFVSANRGQDTATNGRKHGDTPLRTINAAVRQLVRARSGNPKQEVFIEVEPGTYEEVVILRDRMTLMGLQKESDPKVVRLLRPKASSSQGSHSTATPTHDFVLKIQGELVSVFSILIDGDKRGQHGVLIDRSKSVEIGTCMITNCHSKIFHTGRGKGTRADPFQDAPGRTGTGAGMRIQRSEDVKISYCPFKDNRTQQAFRQMLLESEIQELENNLNPAEWTAYKLAGGGNLVRRPEKFRNGGGHISIVESHNVTILNCSFNDGFCGGRGGALQLGKKGYATVEGCDFTMNRAGIDGGAVSVHEADHQNPKRSLIRIKKCVFRANTADDDGGGMYISSNSRVTVESSHFERNKAAANGGGLRATFAAKIDLFDCTFEDNEANTDASIKAIKNQDGGGAIACGNASLKMKGGSCKGNHSHGFAGGAIYFITRKYNENYELAMSKIHGITFESLLKTSSKFNFKRAELRVEKTKFDSNKADGLTCYDQTCTPPSGQGMKRGGAGGAIYVLESLKSFGIPVEVNLSDVQVRNNLSTHHDNNQQSEMVFRNIEKLTLANERVVKHSQNKFLYSLIKVRNKDVSNSNTFGTGPVHES